ncbi:ATP-binding protein [Kitasatospora sp. NPDC096140]|uniref:ATP-binding protein n=1 Tax=Kitasatospora sp. NPDC096140 TaxID=3155425 RepID=UPI00331E7DC0
MTEAPPSPWHPLGITRAVWTVDNGHDALSPLRANAARVLTNWGLEPDGAQLFAVLLVLTEMVTNSSVHSGSGLIDAEMWKDGDRIAVAVEDSSREVPVPRTAGPDDESGRGLFLIRSYSESSGCERWPTGKRMWAVIDPDPSPEGNVLLQAALGGLQPVL